MKPSRWAPAAIVLGLSVLPLGAADEVVEEDDPDKIFTCIDADGNTSFQQEPCEVAKPAPKRAPAAPAPPPSKPKAAKPQAPRPAPVNYMLPATPAKPKALASVPWEPTWRAFVAAMREGDRASALRCLTGGALTSLGPKIQSEAPESLSAMVAPYDRVVVEGEAGPYWSIRVLRAGARPKWVFFARTARGEWKIAAI